MTINSSKAQRLVDDISSGKCIILDGMMSPLTRRLLLIHKADGVDMTQYWIRTAQNWCCPACGRNKEQIVRLNTHNKLMCKLVSHHDHMKDLLLERFRSKSAALSRVVADDVAERFAKRAVSMVAAYDNTLICQDCNTADAKAKKIVGTHSKFSYSPLEIKLFVISKNNNPHEIDGSIAKGIWKDNEDTFSLRLKIVDRIAEIAATNSHWYQEVSFHFHPTTVDRASNAILQYDYNLNELPYHDLGGGGKPTKDYSSWRMKPYISPKEIPSEGDCNHATRVTSIHHWKFVDDDWICPVCLRTKKATIRKNNKDEWSFTLAKKLYRDVSKTTKTERYAICNDCGMVANYLGEEAAKGNGLLVDRYSIWVELDDIASIIKPHPHSRHEILQGISDEVVAKIARVIKAEASE